jgi:hypothetical protein
MRASTTVAIIFAREEPHMAAQKETKPASKPGAVASATTSKASTDKDFAQKRAEEAGGVLPAVSETSDPINRPAGAPHPSEAAEKAAKGKKDEGPKRSWE